MGFLANPATWASAAGLLVAVGIQFPTGLVEHIIAAVGAICGLIGIGESLWGAGHRIRYEGPPPGGKMP